MWRNTCQCAGRFLSERGEVGPGAAHPASRNARTITPTPRRIIEDYPAGASRRVVGVGWVDARPARPHAHFMGSSRRESRRCGGASPGEEDEECDRQSLLSCPYFGTDVE